MCYHYNNKCQLALNMLKYANVANNIPNINMDIKNNMESKKLTQISTFALVMLISGAIDSLRNLPTTALFGPTLIFFFVIAAVLFFYPENFRINKKFLT